MYKADKRYQVACQSVFTHRISNLPSLVIVYETSVEIYNHDFNFKLVSSFESNNTTGGTVQFCTDVDQAILGFPFGVKGQIRVENFSQHKKTIIEAHDSKIGFIALSRDGKLICTASEKGTLLRIFDAETGDQLKELRRGLSKTTITSINFSSDCSYILSSSETGTIHIWSLVSEETKKQSLINKLTKEKSERGCGETKIQEEGELLCSFSPDEPVIRVITSRGNLYHLQFDFEKGDIISDKKKTSIFELNF